MTEWNDGVTRDYWNATPTKLFNIVATRTLFHGLILRETTEKRVWGAMPNPGTKYLSPAK